MLSQIMHIMEFGTHFNMHTACQIAGNNVQWSTIHNDSVYCTTSNWIIFENIVLKSPKTRDMGKTQIDGLLPMLLCFRNQILLMWIFWTIFLKTAHVLFSVFKKIVFQDCEHHSLSHKVTKR